MSSGSSDRNALGAGVGWGSGVPSAMADGLGSDRAELMKCTAAENAAPSAIPKSAPWNSRSGRVVMRKRIFARRESVVGGCVFMIR